MSEDAPRVVELRSPLISRGDSNVPVRPIGIAPMRLESETDRVIENAIVGLGPSFPPIIPGPITLTNNRGAIGTGDPVQLIFWGTAWNQGSTSPSVSSITSAVKTILASPYMSGLRQYGIAPSSFGGATIVANIQPPAAPNTFTDDLIQGFISALISAGFFPEPDEAGGRNLYFVMMPPNTMYSPGGARGAHSFVVTGDPVFDPDKAWLHG